MKKISIFDNLHKSRKIVDDHLRLDSITARAITSSITALSREDIDAILSRLSDRLSRTDKSTRSSGTMLVLIYAAFAVLLSNPRQAITIYSINIVSYDWTFVALFFFGSLYYIRFFHLFLAMQAISHIIATICEYIDHKSSYVRQLSYLVGRFEDFNKTIIDAPDYILFSKERLSLISVSNALQVAFIMIPVIVTPIIIEIEFLHAIPFDNLYAGEIIRISCWLVLLVKFLTILAFSAQSSFYRQ